MPTKPTMHENLRWDIHTLLLISCLFLNYSWTTASICSTQNLMHAACMTGHFLFISFHHPSPAAQQTPSFAPFCSRFISEPHLNKHTTSTVVCLDHMTMLIGTHPSTRQTVTVTNHLPCVEPFPTYRQKEALFHSSKPFILQQWWSGAMRTYSGTVSYLNNHLNEQKNKCVYCLVTAEELGVKFR